MKKGFFYSLILFFGWTTTTAQAAPLVDRVGEFLDSFPIACESDCVDKVSVKIINNTSKNLEMEHSRGVELIKAGDTSQEVIVVGEAVCLFCELGPDNNVHIKPKHLFTNIELKVVDENPLIGGYTLARARYMQKIELEVYQENGEFLIRMNN